MWTVLRQRNFALLWCGALISLTGDWILLVGLPIYIYQVTHSTLATGATFIAGEVPALLLGSLAGVFADRWNRQRTMVVTNALLALTLLPLLVVTSTDRLWIVYVVAFAESAIAQFFRPAKGAILPRLVAADDLVVANSLSSLNENLARLAGPALGGVVVAASGLPGIALLDAASFVLAGVLAALILVPPAPASDAGASAPAAPARFGAALFREWQAGLRVVRDNRTLVVIFLVLGLTSIGEGVLASVLVPWVNRVLHGGGPELGLILSAQAVGGLLGSLLIGHLGRIGAPGRLAGGGALALGLIDLLIFNYPPFIPGIIPALVLMVIVGAPAVAFGAGITTLVQTATMDEYRGRVIGAWATTGALLSIAGMVLGGTFGDAVGVDRLINVQGSVYVAGGLLALLLLPAPAPAPAEHAAGAAAGVE